MHRLEHLRTFGDKSCTFELTVSAQTGALAHFRRHILHFRAHRKCANWSTCALLATNLAFSSSPYVHRLSHLRTFGDKSCTFELAVSAQIGALAHFWRQSCTFELTVSAQTGALAHFWRHSCTFELAVSAESRSLICFSKFSFGAPPPHISKFNANLKK